MKKGNEFDDAVIRYLGILITYNLIFMRKRQSKREKMGVECALFSVNILCSLPVRGIMFTANCFSGPPCVSLRVLESACKSLEGVGAYR